MNLLKSFIERFFRIVILPKEKTTYVVSGNFSGMKDKCEESGTSCVVVGALKNPRQLSVCIRNNFYHIPVAVP